MAKTPTVRIGVHAMLVMSCTLCVDVAGQAAARAVGDTVELSIESSEREPRAWILFGQGPLPLPAFGSDATVPTSRVRKWIASFRAQVDPSCVVRVERECAAADSIVATVLDAGGRVLAVRAVGPDLMTVVEDTVAGRFDLDLARALEAAGRKLADDPDAPALIARIRDAQRRIPEQVLPWQLELSRLASTGEGEQRVDRDYLSRMISALRDRPDALASVLCRAFLIDATIAQHPKTGRAFTRLLGGPLRDSPSIARLGFEVSTAREDLAATQRFAFALVEHCRGDAASIRQLAGRVASLQPAAEFDEILRTCFEFALRARPDDRELLHDYFTALTTRGGQAPDWITAERIGRRLVAVIANDERALNSLAWRLLTEEPWRDRFAPLALAASRQMMRCPEWETHWRIDTVALAEFANGRFQAAVELQERAIAGCEAAVRPRYIQRLARYRTALAAQTESAGAGAEAGIRVRKSQSR